MKPQPPILAITMSCEKNFFHIKENGIKVVQIGDCTVNKISTALQAVSWFFKDFINMFVISIMPFLLLRWKLNFEQVTELFKRRQGDMRSLSSNKSTQASCKYKPSVDH